MSTTNHSARVRAPRLNRLVACLAMALATGSAGALDTASSDPVTGILGNLVLRGEPTSAPRDHAANPDHTGILSNHALFGEQRISNPVSAANRHRAGATRPAPVRPAALVPVTNCNDDGPGSLRLAASNAASGDVLDMHLLSCSTISLTSGAITITADDVTLLGPGQTALTIDGNLNGYVLYGSNLSVTDLTIANGRSNTGFGGCISAFYNLTLTRSTVTGCQAGDGNNPTAYGAGVDVRGDLIMVSSTISGSIAKASEEAFGGGAYVGGFAYLSDSTISGSSALATNGKSRGGGLFAQNAVYMEDSRILNNAVTSTDGTAYGGGIATVGGVRVIGSTISGNTAHSDSKWSYGGGIQAGDYDTSPSQVTLYSSTVSGNIVSADCATCFIQGGGAHANGAIGAWYSAITDNHVISAAASDGKARGGGLATFASGTEGFNVLINSTISGNSAIGGTGPNGSGIGGGMVTIQDSPLGILNSTVAFNRASSKGGGAVGGDAGGSYASVVISSIIASNEAPAAADISGLLSSFLITGNNNLMMSAEAGLTLPADTISVDPKLLPLASNGGPTRTHALAACSPAIDAGSNTFVEATFEWDQRGDPFVREFGAAPDIGAFELQPNGDVIFRNGFEASPCP